MPLAIRTIQGQFHEQGSCRPEETKKYIDGDWNLGYIFASLAQSRAIRPIEKPRYQTVYQKGERAENALDCFKDFNFEDFLSNMNSSEM